MLKRKFVFAHMKVATEYAKLSSCQRLKVGALLVKGDTPIAIGYNGTKPGQDNCCEDPATGRTKPGVRHAEINALNKLWTTNEKATGAVMFVTHAPCIECAQDLYNAGVAEIYFRWHYRDHSGINFLLDNGVPVYNVIVDNDKITQAHIGHSDLGEDVYYEEIIDIEKANQEAARAAAELERALPEVPDDAEDGWKVHKWQTIQGSDYYDVESQPFYNTWNPGH